MAISETQVAKIIYRETIEAYQRGVSPDLTRTAKLISDLTADAGGQPTVMVREQGRKKSFNVEAFNSFMKEVEFDLEVVYEELQTLVLQSMKRLNLNEITYKAQRQQLEEVIGMLDNMLFARTNSDGRFFGVFDTFESMTKIDQDQTTYGAIDLSEGVAQLPFSTLGVNKVDMSHLYGATSWPTSTPNRSDVVSSNIGVNAGFGNAFTDVSNVWRQDVIASNAGQMTLEFKFPVSSGLNATKSINRVQLTPHVGGPMFGELLYSIDGLNVTKVLTSPSVVLERQGQNVNLDFETLSVEEVTLRLTKTEPDEALENGAYLYSFGMANIGLFTTGRSLQADVVSKPQKPAGMTGKVNRISLRVAEERPAETNIQYSVAVSDEEGNIEGDWIPIQPLSREHTGAPSTVDLGASANRFIEQTPVNTSATETVRAIDFFSLPNAKQAGDDAVYGSSRLHRGGNVWSRNKRKETQLKEYRDSYISFNSGDIQKLYVVTTEAAPHRAAYQTFPGGTQGTDLTSTLTLSQSLDWNDATMPLTPPAEVDVNFDQRPNYAVYRVRRFRSSMEISAEQVTLTEEIPVSLTYPHPVVNETTRPVVKNTGGTVTYVEGEDYLVGDGFNGLPNGQINRIATGTIVSGDTVEVDYTIDPDVTHLVDGARDNNIFFNQLLTVSTDDRFEVTYRWCPKGDNGIVRSTVRVTSKYGDVAEGEVYQEGPDYAIDTVAGTITKIPAGGVEPSASGDVAVYVDFYYKSTPPQVETHSAWVYYPSRDSAKIEWSSLAIDTDGGERFMIISPEWSVDLSDKQETPELSRGWYQIVVKTKNPDVFNTSGSCAVRNVIELQDIDGDYAFLPGGKFFSELKAFREPLREVTKDFLQNSTLAEDYSTFCYDDTGLPMVNFDPFNAEDVFRLKVVTTDGVTFTTTESDPENFILEYAYRVGQVTEGQFILLKANLSRGVASDAGLTPKLRRYDIRVS